MSLDKSRSTLIDKTYVRAREMLFNVAGYDHPAESLYASLKYVDGQKWTSGYEAAKQWLAESHPEFVNEYICVPRDEITDVYEPRSRWQTLTASEPSVLSALHREAIALGTELGLRLDIPLHDFGITDSLLWGEGHELSDIDLVVFGTRYAKNIQSRGAELYEERHGELTRPDPLKMTAPYSLQVTDWASLLARKVHMGSYRGRFFSLRVVMDATDLSHVPRKTLLAVGEKTTVTFEVADVRQSLCFPAIYRDAAGNELVDYSVVYEGVFREGDRVRATCSREQIRYEDGREVSRFIVDGEVVLDQSNRESERLAGTSLSLRESRALRPGEGEV